MSLEAQSKQLKQDFDKVYEAGKQAEQDIFWDEFQDYGNRTDYASAFRRWKRTEINPKYKVNPTMSSAMCFYYCNNITALNPEKFDFSKAIYSSTGTTSTSYALFGYCTNLEHLPDLGVQAGYYAYSFAYCGKLRTIEVLRSNEDVLYGSGNSSGFIRCNSLENITIEGVIGKSISFSYSPLTVESIKSVITHLKDYAGTSSEYSYTVTFKTSAFEALEAEGETSPNGNTWAEYIDDLKWNLALAE